MKPIKDYPNYVVNKDGYVFSIRYKRITPFINGSRNYDNVPIYINRVKKLKICKFKKTGYCRVSLSNEFGQRSILLHRIVAEAFIPNPKNLPCVNHKDGDKTNNKASNLEWVTYSDNIKHAFKTGLNSGRPGEMHPMAKLTLNDVINIRDMYKNGKTLKEISLLYNSLSIGHLDAIVKYKRWKQHSNKCSTTIP